MKYFILGFLAVLLASCGSIVAVDYEPDTDWRKYQIYQFSQAHTGKGGEPQAPSGLSQLDDLRIMRAIDSLLPRPEYQRSDYNQFYIDFYVDEQLSESRNTLGIGVGSGGGNVSVGGGIGIPIGGKVINQRLTLEFIDATMGQKLIWQAVYDGELKEKATPAQKDAYYNKVIAKMLKGFPPQK
jgi:hypothetical protein